MLTLNKIKPAPGAYKSSKRVGRGQGSGTGCTAGHGNNGHNARSGPSFKPYFEGGQIPLTRRVPKVGFHNPFKKQYQIVNTGALEKIGNDGDEITPEVLRKKGLIHEADLPVKILGVGELSKSLIVKVHAFSNSAKEKIEKAKGKAEVVGSA
ncbi:50S ribosomal protein L15 [Chitinispirillales bacterium ANBcel5]|uniref:50S ribosomal protein L15 n=1 Tax=Cellulosispirillum alkaliphilum TaxID=3039283 RepID=UPI002A503C3E|nr:50S ribosomal protein L15 [Chitinispirillales bacterium ANBcel5]